MFLNHDPEESNLVVDAALLVCQVIEYDTCTKDEVENEVQLMFSFDHPNIVQAYRCVTYTCVTSTTGSGSTTGTVSVAVRDNVKKAITTGSKLATPRLQHTAAANMQDVSPAEQQRHLAAQAAAKESSSSGTPGQQSSWYLRAGLGPGASSSLTPSQRGQGGTSGGTSTSGGAASSEQDPDKDQGCWPSSPRKANNAAKGPDCWPVAEQRKKDAQDDCSDHSLSAMQGPSRVETW
eukprot:GHUV01018448.1.p1 GENE.GHUV01018448.1~~GHUV01018448.1.p1  ORF type:complete len:235 (+),score=65.39 GHUV01018448.1:2508-3212(+)